MSNNEVISKYYAKELFNASSLGSADSVLELPNHDSNYSFLIRAAGKKYFLRIFNETSSKKMAFEKVMNNNEVYIHKVIGEKGNINVPKLLFAGEEGQGKVAHYITEGYDVPYKKAAIPTIGDRQKLLFQVGADIARVHQIKGDGFGYDNMGLEAKWGVAFKKMVDKVVADAVLNNIKIDTVRIYKIIERAQNILNKVDSRLVHFNLDKSRFFVAKNFINYQGIAGWENSLWGDVAGDFVAFSNPFPLQSSKNFWRGYKSVNPIEIDDEMKIRINIMKMYKGLLMFVEPIYYFQVNSPNYKAYKNSGKKLLQKAIEALEEPFPAK